MELDCFTGTLDGFDIGFRMGTADGDVFVAVPALPATVAGSFLSRGSEVFAVGASGSAAFTADDGEDRT